MQALTVEQASRGLVVPGTTLGRTICDHQVASGMTGQGGMAFGFWRSRQRYVWASLLYRQADSQLHAWPAALQLRHAFGRERIFFDGFSTADGDNLQPGDSIEETSLLFASSSPVALLMIGRSWLGPRLFEPNDLHRREIEAALANRQTCLIPVLVDGAEMPERDELPVSIQLICDRVALRLDIGHTYEAQTARLVRAINRALDR